MNKICKDLADEQAALDDILSCIDYDDWKVVTPFYQWTIHDEIGHIAYYDNRSLLAVTDPDGFAEHCKNINFADFDGVFEHTLEKFRAMKSPDLMTFWIKERTAMINAFKVLDPKARLPWYGPTMSAKSFATARIMETWAHGQDIADALKIDRPTTNRLKHIAILGVNTFAWSYKSKKIKEPEQKVYVELSSPSGDIWRWGDERCKNKVTGSACDFCLVVTQRRNILDTDLCAQGSVAKEWMRIAQAFAGPAETGPEPGRF